MATMAMLAAALRIRVTVQLSELRLASAVGRPPGKASTL
jgi:hypothetical protein